MKLEKSMVEFVLEQGRLTGYDKNDEDWIEGVLDYANFLNKPLEKWMFVPCDEDGNVLKIHKGEFIDESYPKEYQQAKDRVLFEGFEFIGVDCVFNDKIIIHFLNNEVEVEEHFEEIVTKLSKPLETIEDLVKYNLTLTATAIKILGL